jgi:hypothetical protein
MARPRLLSDGKKHEIVAMLACGCTFESAARYACCSVKTIRREARLNAEFHERIRQALISSRVTPVNVLHDYARRDWRAAAWLLERTDPGRFAKRNAKTFTQAEVVDLLGRVYDVVRRQIDDKSKRIQIKRQLRSVVRAALRPATKTKLPSLRSEQPASAVQEEVTPRKAIKQRANKRDAAQSSAPSEPSAPRARAAAQNDPKPRPVLAPAGEVSPTNSSTFAACDGT